MQVFKDNQGLIYTARDYASDLSSLEIVNLETQDFEYKIEHEDFVASVPGEYNLEDLDKDLTGFGLITNIYAPKHYSISRIIAEDWGHNLQTQILGLSLKHLDGQETKTGGKVIKNVSGYDLAKIYIGSANSFAIINGAYLRLEKLPEHMISLELSIQEEARAIYYKQELINFLHKISVIDFDYSFKPSISFSRGLKGLLLIKIDINATSKELLDLKLKRLLQRLENYFKVNFTNIDLNLEESFYQAAEKKLSLSITRSTYAKTYPNEDLRIEFHLPLTEIYDFANNLMDLVVSLNIFSLAQEFKLKIYPKNSRIDLYLPANLLKDWINALRLVKIKSLNQDYFANIFPVSNSTKSLEHKINLDLDNSEYKIISKLKELYDPYNVLNPGILF